MKTSDIHISKGNKSALIFGPTGLVGSHLLNLLLAHDAYTKVIAVSRRTLHIENEKLQWLNIDYEKLEKHQGKLVANDVFICLGTTMAKAKSKDQFRKVDYQYVLNSAKISQSNGASQLMLVSSVGANKDALFFYSRIKGETEEAVKGLEFWSTHIFRPSILLGERNENRFGEQMAGIIGRGLDFVTRGLLTKYRPVEAEIVAKAMINAAQRLESGLFIYPSNWLQKMADQEYGLKKL